MLSFLKSIPGFLLGLLTPANLVKHLPLALFAAGGLALGKGVVLGACGLFAVAAILHRLQWK